MTAPVMTPERAAEARRLAGEDKTVPEAARALGVLPRTLRAWAKRNGVEFRAAGSNRGWAVWRQRDPEGYRAACARGGRTVGRMRRLPIEGEERAAYQFFQKQASDAGEPLTRAELFRLIGRPDLAEAAQ